MSELYRLNPQDIQDFKECVDIVHNAKVLLNDTLVNQQQVNQFNNYNIYALSEIASCLINGTPYYSLIIDDAFTERTTANGNDNVIENSKAEIESIVGKTVKCENLVDWSLEQGAASPNTSGNFESNKRSLDNRVRNSFQQLFNSGTYTLSCASGYEGNIQLYSKTTSLYLNQTGYGTTATITLSEVAYLVFIFKKSDDSNFTPSLENLKPMLIEGSVATTEFQPYFDGLKNSKITTLTSKNSSDEVIDNLTVNFDMGEWCGRYKASNILDLSNAQSQTLNGVTITKNSDNSLTLNGTATGQVDILLYGKTININADLPDGNYYITQFNNTQGCNIRWICNNNDSTLNGTTKSGVIKIANGLGLRCMLRIITGYTFNNEIVKPMLVKGSTIPTIYLPYTDTNYVDVIGGKSYIFTGNENWNRIDTNTSGVYRFTCPIPNLKNATSNATLGNAICDSLDIITTNDTYGRNKEGIAVHSSGSQVITYFNEVQTSTDMANFMKGKTIHYQLATPTYTPVNQELTYQIAKSGKEVIENDNAIYGANATTSINYICATKKGD